MFDNVTESNQCMENDPKSSETFLDTKHGKWRNKLDFIFACICSGIGLGNVWRFPYLCYINGGGAFLLPYFLFALSAGFPIAFLEVSLGQYSSYGCIKAWEICPLMQGVGIASIVMQFLVNIYYNVILAWSFHYLFSSFASTVPWSDCGHSWNTEACFTDIDNTTGLNTNNSVSSLSLGYNVSKGYNYIGGAKTDPVTEYWENKVLGLTEGIHQLGNVKWDLALCLLLTYIFIFVCIMKGIRKSRAVLYFIVCTAFTLLLILLVKGITLPGSLNGIKYFLVPDWGRLADSRVWTDAGTQVFFSYTIGSGVLMTLGSYNKFNHNCLRDASVFISVNVFTSLLSGFVIFSVLGFMANNLGVSIADVAESGPGLTFLAYPKALAKMPLAPFWSILFFITIILLGLSSMLGSAEAVTTSVIDLFVKYLRKRWCPQMVLAAKCVICFILGLPMVTYGGMFIFQLFDFFASSRMGVLVGFTECVIVAHLYGIKRMNENIKSMLGHGLNLYIKACWVIISPLATIIIFVLGLYNYTEVTYNKTYVYPKWAVGFGWVVASASIIFIPGVAITRMIKAPGTILQVQELVICCLVDFEFWT